MNSHSLTRRLPTLAALAAALVGIVNIASALTPSIRWRGHLLLSVEPVQAIKLFHALALPAGAALLLVSPPAKPAGGAAADAGPWRVRPAQRPRLRGDADHLG